MTWSSCMLLCLRSWWVNAPRQTPICELAHYLQYGNILFKLSEKV